MSSNPNNAIGTNGAFGGRTSVNAFNDVMGALSRGILSGWGCVPNSGLTVSLGGNGTARDAAIAEDNAGNRTSINNISNSPINVTIGAAPGTNSRIDAIVAYVDNPPSGTSTVTDNPAACGLIVVQGTTASSPVNPTDAQIRTGITADGASGTTAYYVVIAYITMASGTTDITANEITAGQYAQISSKQIADNAVTSDKINSAAVTADKIDLSTLSGNYSTTEQDTGYTWIDGSKIYKKTVVIASLGAAGSTTAEPHGITNFSRLIKAEGISQSGANFTTLPYADGGNNDIGLYVNSTNVCIYSQANRTGQSANVTIYYTKS